MNAEVIKAMNKKDKTNKVKAWWYNNGYKVLRIVLFPIYLAELAKDRYNQKANAAQTWDEKRSTEILNYYIPCVSYWNNKYQRFYFFDNGTGWSFTHARKYLKRKDRRYWKVNCGWGGYKMRDFLIDTFELEGFTKELGDCSNGWTEMTFFLKE